MILNLRHLRIEYKKYRMVSDTLALRLRALIELAKRRSNFATSYSELDYFFVSEKFKCSERTIQRWLSEYSIKGLMVSNPKSAPIILRLSLRGGLPQRSMSIANFIIGGQKPFKLIWPLIMELSLVSSKLIPI